MSDKISCRLDADVSQALRTHVQDEPKATVSSVVNAALRAYLGVDAPPSADQPTPDTVAVIADLVRRVEALEAARPTERPTSIRPHRKPSTPAAEKLPRASIDGLLTDAQVAETLGRSKGGFQNTVRALGLIDGDTYEGFRVVGKVADPQLGGPPRRVWEPVTE